MGWGRVRGCCAGCWLPCSASEFDSNVYRDHHAHRDAHRTTDLDARATSGTANGYPATDCDTTAGGDICAHSRANELSGSEH